MKPLRGTALYCGIGYGTDVMERHLDEAAAAGINIVFSSLQLPESDPTELLRDFPVMAKLAHDRGMLIDTDIAKRTADQFGVDIFDLSAIRAMGIDIARIDGGYTEEETAKASHNDAGVIIELNAISATEAYLAKLDALGINWENVRFCHNFYPMRYSGMSAKQTAMFNANIHKFGGRVAGFLASQTHRRIACGIGLPTVERERNMPVRVAAQEAFLLGMDDLMIGDDLAEAWELRDIVEADPTVVTFRVQSDLPDGEIADWLFDRPIRPFQVGLPEIIRSHSFGHTGIDAFPGDCESLPVIARRRGEVTLAKRSYLRYAGEVQIARMDLPYEPDMGYIGRIIDEDLPLLEYYDKKIPFRFVRVK